MSETLRLPDLGEGIESGTIISVRVKKNEPVSAGQTLFEVETDKVTVEVPSTIEGTLEELYAGPGDEVHVGHRLASIIPSATTPDSAITTEERQEIGAPPEQAEKPVADKALQHRQIFTDHHPDRHNLAPAGPAARRIARKLGIDINSVAGSGARGRIDKQDVIAFAKQRLQGSTTAGSSKPVASNLPDLSLHGAVESSPLCNIQRTTARNMTRAWQEIPHAWMQEDIDVTELEHQRQRPLTITSFIIKAMAMALETYPLFNASIDPVNDQLLYRHYIDIGVAVDTPRGLVVPVIRGVDTLSSKVIATRISELSSRAKDNSLQPSDFQGASITLSNLGNMGLSSIYPIINWPQSSIVGVAAARWHQRRNEDGQWQERLLLPLTLAFDHRIINGVDGARFVADMKMSLEHPKKLLML